MARTTARPVHSLGTARRPDPVPWVPTPSGEAADAPTGQVAALSPGGPHAGARVAYLDFLRRALAGDEEALVAMFAPSVGFLNRPQTLDRVELARRLRSMLDRTRGRELRLEDIVDPREIRVREVDPSASRGSVIRQGDLVVSAPRLRGPAAPFGLWEEGGSVSLVFRLDGGRYTIVALEL